MGRLGEVNLGLDENAQQAAAALFGTATGIDVSTVHASHRTPGTLNPTGNFIAGTTGCVSSAHICSM
jgi:hypothetical protein